MPESADADESAEQHIGEDRTPSDGKSAKEGRRREWRDKRRGHARGVSHKRGRHNLPSLLGLAGGSTMEGTSRDLSDLPRSRLAKFPKLRLRGRLAAPALRGRAPREGESRTKPGI